MRLSVAFVFFSLMAGCAPSLRAVQQSTTYFERCHAADADPNLSVEDKLACWDVWLAHYTYGQSSHRVRYAERRRAGLTQGERVPPLPGGDRAQVHTLRPEHASNEAALDVAADRAAPPPEAIEQPQASLTFSNRPPDVASRREIRARDRQRPPPPPTRSETPCAHLCDPKWDRCAAPCVNRQRGCLAACRTEHRICLSACY